MNATKNLHTWKKGDDLTAARLNAMRDALASVTPIMPGRGIMVTSTPGGGVAISAFPPRERPVTRVWIKLTAAIGTAYGRYDAILMERPEPAGDIPETGIVTADDVCSEPDTPTEVLALNVLEIGSLLGAHFIAPGVSQSIFPAEIIHVNSDGKLVVRFWGVQVEICTE